MDFATNSLMRFAMSFQEESLQDLDPTPEN